MKVAIVTVDYNNHKDTIELISSLNSIETNNFELKILVVDNGSEAPLSDELPDSKLPLEILQTGINKGFAGGYNHGIRYALLWGADYVFIINNDTTIADPKILTKLIETFRKHPKAGVVTPKILFAPGYEFHKDRYKDSELGKVIWYAGGYFDWNNVQGRHIGIDLVDKGQYNNTKSTEFVTGCCFMAKSEVFEKVGFFDESLFAYFEDVEFINRLRKKFTTYYNGNTFIYHKVSRTTGIGSPLTDYLTTRNRLYYGMSNAPSRTRFALLRESLRLTLLGRSMQRKAIIDYFTGNKSLPVNFRPKYSNPIYSVELSIIVINYKTLNLTKNLLESIFDISSGFDSKKHELILIDNHSEDDIENLIKKYPFVKFIQNKENIGFAKANNQGIDYSKGKYILLLNSDTVSHKNSISNIVNAANKFNEEAIIAGRLILPNGKIQNSCFKLPSLQGAFNEYFMGKNGSYEFFAPSSQKVTKVEGAVMACFLIPRKIVNTIGKLAENSFLYFEDIEYCRRALINNFDIYYDPKSVFDHIHGASSQKLDKGQAFNYLKKGAIFYHGAFYYYLLTLVLWLGQKYKRISSA